MSFWSGAGPRIEDAIDEQNHQHWVRGYGHSHQMRFNDGTVFPEDTTIERHPPSGWTELPPGLYEAMKKRWRERWFMDVDKNILHIIPRGTQCGFPFGVELL